MRELLKLNIDTADLHVLRLNMAFGHLNPFFPFTTETLSHLSDEQLGYLEILSNRFAKLQDLIGNTIFPLVLENLGIKTEGFSLYDCLNKLEKLELLEDAKIWKKMRIVRNKVTHEYPLDQEAMLKNITEIIEQAKILLDYWKFLKDAMDKRIFSIS